jgi:hypothetical protein
MSCRWNTLCYVRASWRRSKIPLRLQFNILVADVVRSIAVRVGHGIRGVSASPAYLARLSRKIMTPLQAPARTSISIYIHSPWLATKPNPDGVLPNGVLGHLPDEATDQTKQFQRACAFEERLSAALIEAGGDWPRSWSSYVVYCRSIDTRYFVGNPWITVRGQRLEDAVCDGNKFYPVRRRSTS